MSTTCCIKLNKTQKKGNKLNFLELQEKLISLTKRNITQSEIATALGLNRSTVSIRTKRGSIITFEEIEKIEKYFATNLKGNDTEILKIPYKTRVFIDVDYKNGTKAENFYIFDKKMFNSLIEKSQNALEIVNIAGNSTSPYLPKQSKTILDKSVKNFVDGQIFAFRYEGINYIREINLLKNQAKCIPLNKNYEDFYIDLSENYEIFGQILCNFRF